jgi:hypothetical protein
MPEVERSRAPSMVVPTVSVLCIVPAALNLSRSFISLELFLCSRISEMLLILIIL